MIKTTMPKNRLLFFAYLALMLCLGSTTQANIKKWQLELKELEEKQETLFLKELPHMQGLFVTERTEMLTTNKEIQLLIIELKKALIESKIALHNTQKQLAQLIQTFTYFIYFISTLVCVFFIAYLVK